MKRSCIVSNLEWLIFMSLANSLWGFKHRTFGSYVQNGDRWHFTHFASRVWFELQEDDLFYRWLHLMIPCTILRTLRKRAEVSGNHTKNKAGYYQCWCDIVFFLHLSGIYNEDFTFFDTGKVWVFADIVVFDTIQVYIPCVKLHTSATSC